MTEWFQLSKAWKVFSCSTTYKYMCNIHDHHHDGTLEDNNGDEVFLPKRGRGSNWNDDYNKEDDDDDDEDPGDRSERWGMFLHPTDCPIDPLTQPVHIDYCLRLLLKISGYNYHIDFKISLEYCYCQKFGIYLGRISCYTDKKTKNRWPSQENAHWPGGDQEDAAADCHHGGEPQEQHLRGQEALRSARQDLQGPQEDGCWLLRRRWPCLLLNESWSLSWCPVI